jgi:NhaA family Na+:H+ antiporter
MDHEDRPLGLPSQPITRLTDPINRFLHIEAASGVVLLVAATIAFALANSPWSEGFLDFWETRLSLGIGDLSLDHSLKHWVSDGLMALFFFVVGLEVKREFVLGELRDARQAGLPIAAAIGGMVVPALFYLALAGDGPAARGWGIPMATDIAFVVGCMAVLGSRVPASLRVLLLTLAIADDIGAILVIAIGYTSDLSLAALALGFSGIALIVFLSRLGVRSVLVYGIVGLGVWEAFHESGVHATIAGVILGLLTPARPWVSDSRFAGIVERAGDLWRGEGGASAAPALAVRQKLERAARESISPLERLETGLHPWSAFLIMPIFALANAGVAFEPALLTDPAALAIGAGLVLGKPVGIVLASFLAVRLGIARLPDGLGWGVLASAGLLAGIGFTMSLFIAGLALEGPVLDAAKVGILVASLVAGVLGMSLLVWQLKPAGGTRRDSATSASE